MHEDRLWRVAQHGKDLFDLLRRDGFLRRNPNITVGGAPVAA
jgi:hypothetical protein